jgi:serine/threonine protein kinase
MFYNYWKILKEFGPLNETQIAYVCRETLYALEFIHLNGYIHRDIKADNILLNHKGEIKLADFGVSTIVSNYQHDTYCGTPLW